MREREREREREIFKIVLEQTDVVFDAREINISEQKLFFI